MKIDLAGKCTDPADVQFHLGFILSKSFRGVVYSDICVENC